MTGLFDLIKRDARMSLLDHFRADSVGGWSLIITTIAICALAARKLGWL